MFGGVFGVRYFGLGESCVGLNQSMKIVYVINFGCFDFIS